MPPHKPVTGGLGPHALGPPSGPLSTLPDWWGKIGPTQVVNYGDQRFPLSRAIAPDALIPLCYGAVRIGGTELQFGSVPGQEMYHGRGVIAWCEGAIEAIDSLLIDGATAPPSFTNAQVIRTIQHYTGTPFDPQWDTAGQIFFGKDVSGFFDCAHTFIDVHAQTTSPPAGGWLGFLPQMQGAQFEWAANVRGLRIYDPRDVAQDSADPTTWLYSNNPALIVRDLLRRIRKMTDAELDDTSFSNAADLCDTKGFTCNIAFATKTTLSAALAIVLQTCNGRIIESAGRAGLFLEVANPAAAVATLSEEDGDIWNLKYEYLSARDRITRMAVSFFNSAADYKQDVTPDFDDPGIALGTVPVRPLIVNAPGINTLAAAIILRDYLFNRQAITLRVSGSMSTRGITLTDGSKINLETTKGVDTDFILEQHPGTDKGFFTFVAKPYDAAVFGTTPISQGPPIFPPVPGSIAPPVYTHTDSGAWPTAFKLRWEPRSILPLTYYGASFWTVSSTSAYNTSRINDGLFVDTCLDFSAVGAGQTATFDSGVGAARRFIGMRLVYAPSVTVTTTILNMGPVVIYSDPDAPTLVDYSVGGGPGNQRFIWIAGVLRGCEYEWDDVGPQRYWELQGGGGLGLPGQVYSEVQFLEADGVTWIDADIHSYEIHVRKSHGLVTNADPLVLTVESAMRPTTASYLDMTPYTYQTGETDIGTSLNILDFLSALIVTVSKNGTRNAGVEVDISGYAYAGETGALRIPLVDHTKLTPPPAGAAALVISTVDDLPYLAANGGAYVPIGGPGGGGGSVTSVGQTAPADLLSVSGSPVTTSGTLALAKVPVAKNKFYGGPAAGADANPTFREITNADVATLNRMVICRPAGLIDGSNRHFVLPTLPVSPRILLFVDTTLIEGGVDYFRTGVDVFIRPEANAPRFHVDASYWGPNDDDTSGPEDPPVGTADTWTAETVDRYDWFDVTWAPGPGLFVAVGWDNSVGHAPGRIATSPDGETWTLRTPDPTSSMDDFISVCWSESLQRFVIVSNHYDEVQISLDGVTWTKYTIPTSAGNFNRVVYGNRFVAVAEGGSVMWSDDGENWTAIAAVDLPGGVEQWTGIAWSPSLGLYAAVTRTTGGATTQDVMTSPDGKVWTLRTTPSLGSWRDICWSEYLGLFVAVRAGGTSAQSVMTSPDGETWTPRTTPSGAHDWYGVCWSDSRFLFVAVGDPQNGGTAAVMTSPDGFNWTLGTSIADSRFYKVVSGDSVDIIVAVAINNSTNDQVMRSLA